LKYEWLGFCALIINGIVGKSIGKNYKFDEKDYQYVKIPELANLDSKTIMDGSSSGSVDDDDGTSSFSNELIYFTNQYRQLFLASALDATKKKKRK
jgi:hypothetical protein